MDKVGSIFYLTETQMWILIINDTIQSFCWTYPFMSISADLMTCHVIEEMGNIYWNWNNVLEMDLKKRDVETTSLDKHFMLNGGENSRLGTNF